MNLQFCTFNVKEKEFSEIALNFKTNTSKWEESSTYLPTNQPEISLIIQSEAIDRPLDITVTV